MKYEVFWKNPRYKVRPELTRDISCDYLIVGGGITGVSLAYFLSDYGAKNIVLIEKKFVGNGATGKSAGTLVIRGESDLSDLVKVHGRKKAFILWNKTMSNLDLLNHLIVTENIDCDFERLPTLYCGYKHKNYNDLHQEFQLIKKIPGRENFLSKEEIKKEINTSLFSHGILSHEHGISVNPLKLTQNFSRIVESKEVKIYEGTSLLKFSNNRAQTAHGSIHYKKILLAIDAEHPSQEVKKMKSTIIVTRQLTYKEIESMHLHNRKIIFDTQKNYHYLKLTKDNRLLIGFGGITVHKKHTKTDPHYPHVTELEQFVKKMFPYLSISFDYVWSGSFGFTQDFHPHIEIGKEVSSISGAGTQVLCFMAAKYVAEKIVNKKSSLDIFFNKRYHH